MQKKFFNNKSRAFTLVELLTVIVIIGVLASMLLPALSKAQTNAKITKARQEMADFKVAIKTYETDYSRPPGPPEAMESVAGMAACPDFTYGTRLGSRFGAGTVTGKASPLPDIRNAGNFGGGAVNYQANNSELVTILMGVTNFPSVAVTVNTNHQYNPKRNGYLNAPRTTGAGSSTKGGVGDDGVYRDPFGNPYIVTLDLNFDGNCRDAFYRSNAVSQGTSGGINGLSSPSANLTPNDYELRDSVMIWSFGPDGRAGIFSADGDNTINGQKVSNKDNILTWGK